MTTDRRASPLHRVKELLWRISCNFFLLFLSCLLSCCLLSLAIFNFLFYSVSCHVGIDEYVLSASPFQRNSRKHHLWNSLKIWLNDETFCLNQINHISLVAPPRNTMSSSDIFALSNILLNANWDQQWFADISDWNWTYFASQ